MWHLAKGSPHPKRRLEYRSIVVNDRQAKSCIRHDCAGKVARSLKHLAQEPPVHWSVGQTGSPQTLYISSDIFWAIVWPEFIFEIGDAQCRIELLQPLPRAFRFLHPPGARGARLPDPACRASF